MEWTNHPTLAFLPLQSLKGGLCSSGRLMLSKHPAKWWGLMIEIKNPHGPRRKPMLRSLSITEQTNSRASSLRLCTSTSHQFKAVRHVSDNQRKANNQPMANMWRVVHAWYTRILQVENRDALCYNDMKHIATKPGKKQDHSDGGIHLHRSRSPLKQERYSPFKVS